MIEKIEDKEVVLTGITDDVDAVLVQAALSESDDGGEADDVEKINGLDLATYLELKYFLENLKVWRHQRPQNLEFRISKKVEAGGTVLLVQVNYEVANPNNDKWKKENLEPLSKITTFKIREIQGGPDIGAGTVQGKLVSAELMNKLDAAAELVELPPTRPDPQTDF